jgi:transposase
MIEDGSSVVAGVDSHAEAHHVAALDARGRLLGTAQFATTTVGYRELLTWLENFGRVDTIAVESTGSYASGLVRYLHRRRVQVVEVNRPHAHTRRRVGKSDPIDAEMAARQLLAGKATAMPKQTDGIVESIRLLRAARNSAVKARSAALVQMRDLIITAPQQLRDQLRARRTLRARRRRAPTSGSAVLISRTHRWPRSSRSDLWRDGSSGSTARSQRWIASSSGSCRAPHRARCR